jgi:hypothetical protein
MMASPHCQGSACHGTDDFIPNFRYASLYWPARQPCTASVVRCYGAGAAACGGQRQPVGCITLVDPHPCQETKMFESHLKVQVAECLHDMKREWLAHVLSMCEKGDDGKLVLCAADREQCDAFLLTPYRELSTEDKQASLKDATKVQRIYARKAIG